MDFTKLRKGICDVIKEEQIKLGYRKEAIRLYYPLQSLNRTLGTDLDVFGMLSAMQDFAECVKEEFGPVQVSCKKERFCLFLPEEASEYVHTHTEQAGFLYDFIDLISRHGTTVGDVLALFQKYSNRVHCERVDNGEFDYLIYFEDGEPDEYLYCLKDEGCHLIYHRYTAEDYEDFGFGERKE